MEYPVERPKHPLHHMSCIGLIEFHLPYRLTYRIPPCLIPSEYLIESPKETLWNILSNTRSYTFEYFL